MAIRQTLNERRTFARACLVKCRLRRAIDHVGIVAIDDNAFEPMLRALALRDYDLIIGIGFAQKEAIQKVAAQFPKRHFAIVDAQVQAPNVRSLMFQEHEGAYVVGAIAALTSKTGKIGFVGGMDIPLIRRFEMGYTAGVLQSSGPGYPVYLKLGFRKVCAIDHFYREIG